VLRSIRTLAKHNLVRTTNLVGSRLVVRLQSTASLYANPVQAQSLQIIPTLVAPQSPEFQEKAKAMSEIMTELDSIHNHITSNDKIPEKIRSKHLARKKLLPRDRIAALIDPGTTFLELSQLAGYKMYGDEDIRAGGIISGIGIVQGVKCLIIANDSTVKGGTYYPITVQKHLRAQQIAMENRLPCLYLSDSGGANLPHQADVFPSHNHFGRIFFQQSRMSSMGIPQLALVMGPCTAGGAYVPAMSDEAIIVKGTGHVFLAGPPLVKAATGEVISAEELGGGEMHSSVSGVVDYLAESEEEGIAMLKQLVSNLNWVKSDSSKSYEEPLYPPEELAGVVGTNLRVAYNVREVIARIVDGSRFSEFKKNYGTSLVCGWSKIYGHPVGILANNGPLFSDSSLKGAHFIQLCKKRNIPLVFLQNISGFMVGSEAERGGIAKNGAKLVTAVVGAGVEKYTVIIGGSYGAGNYGMCGRAYEPRFLWSWPNARTGVMGAEQLASVMETVGSNKAKNDQLRARIESETEVKFGSARLWDDGVIKPEDTRHYLGQALELRADSLKVKERAKITEHDDFGVWRM
jgi:3-methylcrotonyl-CoA carboxylase beta subunit